MKYLSIILVSAATLLISVKGKIPDYIHVCKSNDPELNKCVSESILNLRDKLAKGIPELDVPAIDPLRMDVWNFDLGPGFKAINRNVVVKGGTNFDIQDLTIDIDANTFSFVVKLPELSSTADYELDATIASIPIKGEGKMRFTARSVTARGTLHGKRVQRNGKSYNWFPSMDMKLDIGDYEVALDNLFGGDEAVGKSINKLLNDEKTEVQANWLPLIEKKLIEHILLTANNICKNFTWDELFPES